MILNQRNYKTSSLRQLKLLNKSNLSKNNPIKYHTNSGKDGTFTYLSARIMRPRRKKTTEEKLNTVIPKIIEMKNQGLSVVVIKKRLNLYKNGPAFLKRLKGALNWESGRIVIPRRKKPLEETRKLVIEKIALLKKQKFSASAIKLKLNLYSKRNITFLKSLEEILNK